MIIKTADLCDSYPEKINIANPIFRDFGQKLAFAGNIITIKCSNDNSLVRDALESSGHNNVLVIDGGASMECALLGDQLAELACKNHWEGIVVNGCIRDAAEILQINIGVKAITTHPLKSIKRGVGEKNISVDFAGISFAPGDYLYADIDGVIVTPSKLT
ncbi:MAG: ribonuclease E activity regulator RraA [Pseudomonadota bacterium]